MFLSLKIGYRFRKGMFLREEAGALRKKKGSLSERSGSIMDKNRIRKARFHKDKTGCAKIGLTGQNRLHEDILHGGRGFGKKDFVENRLHKERFH